MGSRTWAQWLWSKGLVALWHVESSCTRDQTYIPYAGMLFTTGPPGKCKSIKLYNYLGKLCGNFYSSIIYATRWHSVFPLMYLPKRNENKYPHKDFYTDVHSSLIYSSSNLETTQTSINTGMDEQFLPATA